MVPISSQKTKSQTSINSAGSQGGSGGRTPGATSTLALPNNGIFAWMRVFRFANLLVQAGC